MPKEYVEAESVSNTALQLIPTFHPELASARLRYIFVDKGSMKNGKPVLGKVRKISGAFEFLLETDFLIEVAMDFWNELTSQQRTALVDHLLERCTGEENDEDGSMSWSVREPDVQEFTNILRRYGAWNDSLAGFVSAAQEINVEELVEDAVGEHVQVEEAAGGIL